VFYNSIFQGMKGNDTKSSPGIEKVWYLFHDFFQTIQLLVYLDPQGLKHPGGWMDFLGSGHFCGDGVHDDIR